MYRIKLKCQLKILPNQSVVLSTGGTLDRLLRPSKWVRTSLLIMVFISLALLTLSSCGKNNSGTSAGPGYPGGYPPYGFPQSLEIRYEESMQVIRPKVFERIIQNQQLPSGIYCNQPYRLGWSWPVNQYDCGSFSRAGYLVLSFRDNLQGQVIIQAGSQSPYGNNLWGGGFGTNIYSSSTKQISSPARLAVIGDTSFRIDANGFYVIATQGVWGDPVIYVDVYGNGEAFAHAALRRTR